MSPATLRRPCMYATSGSSEPARSESAVSGVREKEMPSTSKATMGSATSTADAVAHAGEDVVLGRVGVDERAGQLVLVVGVDRARLLGRQAEPERRRRVDLGGVGLEGRRPHVHEVAHVD